MKRVKTLIVDDSAVVRQALTEILEEDKGIQVVATAPDPYYAVKKISKFNPDVITLDIEMPRMDGITFLRKIMSQHPIPCVVISSLTTSGAETSIRALEYGAVEIITKPGMYTNAFDFETRIRIIDAVKAAACAKISRKMVDTEIRVTPKYSVDVVIPSRTVGSSMLQTTEKVVAIGASTGGTEAIRELLMGLPRDCPGIVIVQHMPEEFTRSFAARLNELCKITVREASNGDSVLRGHALIAPGNYHTLLKRSGAKYYVEVKEGQFVNRHRPSVDVLFRSVAQYAGKNAVGVILTGMGDDGAAGLQELFHAGAHTAAQDEESSIVFGMPKEAIKRGAAQKVLPLAQMAKFIMSHQE